MVSIGWTFALGKIRIYRDLGTVEPKNDQNGRLPR